ncbi:MAG TPA: methionine--tRNA ligase [Ktedonobacterales bacterium]|nr:methionine--tRNA ligase [Ktedonobacterales bacterium]
MTAPHALPERILVCVAWPYARSATHVGQIAGSFLPGDIFARYHRMAGNEVLMVSGSDEHGTPITIDAERAGITPRELVARYHPQIVAISRRLAISWDLYTETTTPNHHRVTQEVFLRLLEQGYLFTDSMDSPYCPTDRRFLPDRYIEGTCPYCEYLAARGDQCDNCGRPLDPTQLIAPRCRLCGSRDSTIEILPTEHFLLDLPQFEAPLIAWLQAKSGHWRPHVLNFALNWVKEGLKPRAITRDLEWGVPLPVAGYPGKRIYVWFDALIGYLSASREWAELQGDPTRWERWWRLGASGEAPARAYYFVGKDNIAFHTIIWPAILLGVGSLALPYDVPATEFMVTGSVKASTSLGNVIWTADALDAYGPDALRYYLAATMPEERDTTFSYEELVRRNNDELVATYGNAVHRVLTFAQRHFQARVPQPGPLRPADEAILAAARAALTSAAAALGAVRLRDGLGAAMGLARATNRYLEERAPWKTIKTQPDEAATTIFVMLQVLNALKTLFAPYLPHASQRLHELLGFTGDVARTPWAAEPVAPGQPLPVPAPLFAKFDAPAPPNTSC